MRRRPEDLELKALSYDVLYNILYCICRQIHRATYFVTYFVHTLLQIHRVTQTYYILCYELRYQLYCIYRHP